MLTKHDDILEVCETRAYKLINETAEINLIFRLPLKKVSMKFQIDTLNLIYIVLPTLGNVLEEFQT